LRYDNAMKPKMQSAGDVTGDFAKYQDFMRKLLAVPHSRIQAKLEAEKAAKRTPKGRASRVSGVRAKPA
jgi:hypothetical protein